MAWWWPDSYRTGPLVGLCEHVMKSCVSINFSRTHLRHVWNHACILQFIWCFHTIHLFYLFLAVFIHWRQLLRFVGNSEKERITANIMNEWKVWYSWFIVSRTQCRMLAQKSTFLVGVSVNFFPPGKCWDVVSRQAMIDFSTPFPIQYLQLPAAGLHK